MGKRDSTHKEIYEQIRDEMLRLSRERGGLLKRIKGLRVLLLAHALECGAIEEAKEFYNTVAGEPLLEPPAPRLRRVRKSAPNEA